MQCPSCGAHVGPEDLFCGECGRPLLDTAPPAEPPDSPEQAEQVEGKLDLAPTLTAPMIAPAAPVAARRSSRRTLWLTLLLAGIGLLLICLLGGGVLLLIDVRQVVEPTTVWTEPTSAIKVEPTPAVGSLLYEDGFDDPGSGWDIYDDDDTTAGYMDGEYGLAVHRDNFVTWGNPTLQRPLADFVVEVDARQVKGPLDNNFGILVRYQPDDDTFYWFQISGDGYYSVDMSLGSEWAGLAGWEASEAIHQGLDATNHLQVTCNGDQFDFYVNGVYLTSVTDDWFEEGNIGLAAGTFDEPGVEIRFDNLRVYSLP